MSDFISNKEATHIDKDVQLLALESKEISSLLVTQTLLSDSKKENTSTSG